jgi:hypothetical protein
MTRKLKIEPWPGCGRVVLLPLVCIVNYLSYLERVMLSFAFSFLVIMTPPEITVCLNSMGSEISAD